MSYTDVEVSSRTRQAWAHFGFVCWFDEFGGNWRIAGSRHGLHAMCARLRAADASGQPPYPFVELGPQRRAHIGVDGIAGTPEDMWRLAELIERELLHAVPGSTRLIDWQFAQRNDAGLVIEVCEDSYDPESAPLLEQSSSPHRADTSFPWL